MNNSIGSLDKRYYVQLTIFVEYILDYSIFPIHKLAQIYLQKPQKNTSNTSIIICVETD